MDEQTQNKLGDLLKIEQVADRYQVEPRTIQNWVRDGRFPQPMRLSRRLLRWRLADLIAFEQGE